MTEGDCTCLAMLILSVHQSVCPSLNSNNAKHLYLHREAQTKTQVELDPLGGSVDWTPRGLCDLSVGESQKPGHLQSLTWTQSVHVPHSRMGLIVCVGFTSTPHEEAAAVTSLMLRKATNPSSCILQTSRITLLVPKTLAS